jgi:purine-binding chemotaxis protein CheW
MTRRDTLVPAAPAEGGKASKPKEPRGEEVREFLAFGLAGERFALPLGTVQEILKVAPVTEVPRARPYVLGILSVRGRITTVLDLRRRLRMPPADETKQSRILLVKAGEEVIGLLVDEVHQVHRLHEEEMELAAVVAGDLSEYVLGIGRPGRLDEDEAAPGADEDILILLDPEPLLKR